MGESSEDELWSDIERDIAEFKKKVEFGKADGYFWNMYFNLLRSNRLMFAGMHSVQTGLHRLLTSCMATG